MFRPKRSRSRAAAALVLLAACTDAGKSVARATDSALPIVAAADTGTKANCPVTGLWAQCLLLKRLEQSGFAVRTDSLREVREPSLSIPGRRLPIGYGEIAYFIYADTGSRARDQAKLDTTAFISAARETGVRDRTLIANLNLLVIMKVLNGANRERIANAIMAGQPQPAKGTP
jgi:hypothetical protein